MAESLERGKNGTPQGTERDGDIRPRTHRRYPCADHPSAIRPHADASHLQHEPGFELPALRPGWWSRRAPGALRRDPEDAGAAQHARTAATDAQHTGSGRPTDGCA